jgi:hypothetical protein
MTQDGRTAQAGPRSPDRAARLKAALKANMARRKAQARARQDRGPDLTDGTAEPDPDAAGGEGGQQ